MNEYRIQRLKEDLTYAQQRNKNQKQQLANYKKVHEKDLKEIGRLKDRIARANNFIDQVLLYRIPNKTKEVYEDIETLQDILNDNDFAKGSDKEWKDI